MLRFAWKTLALSTLALWASLIPQVTYPTATTGEPSHEVLTAWPGWGVQQDLGRLGGTVGQFDIWMSSEPNADPNLTVIASLLDAQSRDVVRQMTSHVTSSAIPVRRTLTFPSYVVPDGQSLLLQLQVPDDHEYPVIYRLAPQQADYRNVMLNGVADAGAGPLAFAHQVTSSGVRAALHGEPDAQIRLVFALLLSGLAMLAHPRAAIGLRCFDRIRTRISWLARAWGRLAGPMGTPARERPPTGLRRVLALPWYPWPAAVIPILHFLAINQLHFTTSAAILPVVVVLAVVSVAVVALRLVLRGWHQAAAVVAIATMLFFTYGHVEQALAGQLSQLVLFPAAVALSAAAAWMAIQVPGLALRWASFLNLATSILLIFQLTVIAGNTLEDATRNLSSDTSTKIDTTSHLFDQWPTRIPSTRPNIYYIILDGYGRHDALGEFDNTDFVNELERRGFYVATEGTSNYKSSLLSLASSLNLAYLDDLGLRSPTSKRDAVALVQNSALVTILKRLGYTYVHLESGQSINRRAPLADVFVTFAPAGIGVSRPKLSDQRTRYIDSTQNAAFFSAMFQTTALRTIIGRSVRISDTSPYDWWAPERALLMFDYLSARIATGGPKFVFAHIMKPHLPATFDRHGNVMFGQGSDVGFSNTHDPTVPDAYIGQLIFINSLVLKSVDGILNNDDDPIILIAGDHGGPDGYPRHPILAAFRLANGRSDPLYPSISSANHFRYILDQYFNLGIGLLEDRIIMHAADRFDFTAVTEDR